MAQVQIMDFMIGFLRHLVLLQIEFIRPAGGGAGHTPHKSLSATQSLTQSLAALANITAVGHCVSSVLLTVYHVVYPRFHTSDIAHTHRSCVVSRLSN